MPGVRGHLERRAAGQLAPAIGGVACQYCARRRVCADAIDSEALVPADDAEAVDMFQQAVRLKAAYDERWALLKRYFQDRNPVEVGELEVGWLRPAPSWKCTDPVGMYQLLSQKGIDARRWLSAISTGMPRRVKDELVRAGLAVVDHQGEATFKARRRATQEIAMWPTEEGD